ncbi:uncharacterized protein V1518DRAFT_419030 [Limtongia smithiae]|uniref:uncharacterized protein n=1 Tax=Limtongia smithiae TaxID=1125753 RepID=UPI0034CF7659
MSWCRSPQRRASSSSASSPALPALRPLHHFSPLPLHSPLTTPSSPSAPAMVRFARPRSASFFPLRASPAGSPTTDSPATFPADSDNSRPPSGSARTLSLAAHAANLSSSSDIASLASGSRDEDDDDDDDDATAAADAKIETALGSDFDPKLIPPELESIISLISSAQARCYHEGNFVFLRDLDAGGKTPANRAWQSVYGQLAGTVLSVWDAADLARAGPAAVDPTYINIADASFRIVASLPTPGGPAIANVIALSTTAKNRFLLRFPSQSQMLVWAAALHLAMFEFVSLQEAYTGALLAGLGSKMNGIRLLLQESKFKHQEWVVVRFGIGMPYVRCWAVVTPSGYKKRKRNKVGHIDFYESKKAKQKKHKPLATVTAAKAAYAFFPESSLLIMQSTLVKIEGTITMYNHNAGRGEPKGTAHDGFIFVMPEKHAGVYGFETLIRFLIPALDAFSLYGRPQRFNADKNDIRSIMFGLPDAPNTRYIALADVYDLVSAHPFEESWTEQTWRAEIRTIIVQRIAAGTRNVNRQLPRELQRQDPPTRLQQQQAQQAQQTKAAAAELLDTRELERMITATSLNSVESKRSPNKLTRIETKQSVHFGEQPRPQSAQASPTRTRGYGEISAEPRYTPAAAPVAAIPATATTPTMDATDFVDGYLDDYDEYDNDTATADDGSHGSRTSSDRTPRPSDEYEAAEARYAAAAPEPSPPRKLPLPYPPQQPEQQYAPVRQAPLAPTTSREQYPRQQAPSRQGRPPQGASVPSGARPYSPGYGMRRSPSGDNLSSQLYTQQPQHRLPPLYGPQQQPRGIPRQSAHTQQAAPQYYHGPPMPMQQQQQQVYYTQQHRVARKPVTE